MPHPLSKDLREHGVGFVNEGHARREASVAFQDCCCNSCAAGAAMERDG